MKYAIRIPSNDSLERDIDELLTRPVGRPGQKRVVWYKRFLFRATGWKTARLSCHRFRSNEVPLWSSVMAYNPGTRGGDRGCRSGSKTGRWPACSNASRRRAAGWSRTPGTSG